MSLRRRQQLLPAAHVLDIGSRYRLVSDKVPAGSQLFAAAEPGIPVKQIAEAVGRELGVPAVSISAGQPPNTSHPSHSRPAAS